MLLIRRTFFRVLPLAAPLLACVNSTAPRLQPAQFVLRSIAGQPLPASVVVGGVRQLYVADTLFVGAAESGVLHRTAVEATDGAAPVVRRSVHDYQRRAHDLFVFFACESRQPCLAISTSERGSLSTRELRFAARGSFTPERLYERVQ